MGKPSARRWPGSKSILRLENGTSEVSLRRDCYLALLTLEIEPVPVKRLPQRDIVRCRIRSEGLFEFLMRDDERPFELVQHLGDFTDIRLESPDDVDEVSGDLRSTDTGWQACFLECDGHEFPVGERRRSRNVPHLTQCVVVFAKRHETPCHIIYEGIGVGLVNVAEDIHGPTIQ